MCEEWEHRDTATVPAAPKAVARPKPHLPRMRHCGKENYPIERVDYQNRQRKTTRGQDEESAGDYVPRESKLGGGQSERRKTRSFRLPSISPATEPPSVPKAEKEGRRMWKGGCQKCWTAASKGGESGSPPMCGHLTPITHPKAYPNEYKRGPSKGQPQPQLPMRLKSGWQPPPLKAYPNEQDAL